MAMTADEAATIAASQLTTRNVTGVTADYKAWIVSKPTLATAVLALLAVAKRSKSPARVLALAATQYAATEADPPTITSLTPNSGLAAGGTAFTMVGTNLTGLSALTIGGVACTSRVVVDDTHVTAVSPAKAAGTYDVIATTPAGSVTKTNGFTTA